MYADVTVMPFLTLAPSLSHQIIKHVSAPHPPHPRAPLHRRPTTASKAPVGGPDSAITRARVATRARSAPARRRSRPVLPAVANAPGRLSWSLRARASVARARFFNPEVAGSPGLPRSAGRVDPPAAPPRALPPCYLSQDAHRSHPPAFLSTPRPPPTPSQSF
jgi:hypothetical protein